MVQGSARTLAATQGFRDRLLAGRTAADLTENEVDELFNILVQLLESEPNAFRDKSVSNLRKIYELS